MAWNDPNGSGEPADLMLISAHPDDEGIFGGGMLPYYAQILGLNVVLLGMCTTAVQPEPGVEPTWAQQRYAMLRRAVDLYAGNPAGGSTNPSGDYVSGNVTLVAGELQDTQGPENDPREGNDPTRSWDAWTTSAEDGRTLAGGAVAAAIARYEPEIVACAHNLHGDYGHTNHTATSIAAVEGVGEARTASPARAVEKLYLRGAGADNTVTWPAGTYGSPFVGTGGSGQLLHDYWERRIIAGSSARQVANHGVRQHWSEYYLQPQVLSVHCQPVGSYAGDWGYLRSEEWTLYASGVGADTPTNPNVNGHVYTGWAAGDFRERSSVTSVASLATPPGFSATGVNVSVVEYPSGSLESLGCGAWQQFAEGHDGPVRTLRDGYFQLDGKAPAPFRTPVPEDQVAGWNDGTRITMVELVGGAPQLDHRLVLDMRAGTVTDPDGTTHTIERSNQRVNGRAVRAVEVAGGAFQQVLDPDTREPAPVWKEYDAAGVEKFTFRETGRDMWSVYLEDEQQRRLQIDVHRLWIRYADRNHPEYYDLYAIVATR